MKNRIDCPDCPLLYVSADRLCESNCDDMADYRDKIYNKAIDDCIQFIKDHSGEHYIDCDGYFGGELETVFNLDNWMDDLEQLKEGGKND